MSGFLDPKPLTRAGLDAATAAELASPGSATNTALSGAFGRQIPPLHGVRYKAYGHSFGVYDAGTSMNLWPNALYHARIRDVIRADSSMYLNACVGNDQMKDTAQRALGDATRFWNAGDFGLITLMGAQNDFGRNRSAMGIQSYIDSLRAFLSTVRAKTRIESAAATKANASDFVVMANSGCSNGQFEYTSTIGGTFTFTGNTFTDATLMLVGFSDGGGSNFEVRVDGVLKASGNLSFRHTATGNNFAQFGPVPVQLTGLTNTAHTVEVKSVAGSGTTLSVDCLLPWTATPPQVVLIKDVKDTTAGYARYSSPPTDADVVTWNGYMTNVANEFPADGSITIADAYSIYDPATMTGADGQHPNDRGHATIAESVLTALAPLPYRKGMTVSA